MDKAIRMNNQFDLTHWTGHILSLGAIISTIVGWLPAVAALAGAIWYAVQIYESKTVQDWLRTRRHRKIERLQSQIESLAQKQAKRDAKELLKIEPPTT